MPVAVRGAAGAMGADGRIYVFSGANALGPLIDGALVAKDSCLYYIGGSKTAGINYAAVDSVYRYSITYDTWDALPSMPHSTAALAGILGPDGLIYVMGGGPDALNVGPAYSSCYFLDVNTWRWGELPTLNTASKYSGAAASDDGRILLMGGNDNAQVFDRVESLRLFSLEVALWQDSVGQGEELTIEIACEHALGAVEGMWANAYLMSDDGTSYPAAWFSFLGVGPFVLFLSVPRHASPGSISWS